ncbi:MAG TPA: TonB-dependent receptor [Saprospiraceae bacterium]|nr:TonB-dependent receptor [Saprospiraceae bacterium]HMP24987.1 TonB-dependent receptor [Saprospiraceae bacterium]
MKKLSLVLMLVMASAMTLMAQRTITGKVVDDTNTPLIGATILVLGTSSGTVSDVDGNFSLVVPAEQNTIVVSYTGFSTRTVALGTESYYAITLESEAALLQDVVVIGYGTATRKELTGSVAKVDAETIGRLPVTGLDQALQGQAAGVQVTTSSGTPGSSVAVRVRGTSSISSGSQPLYVVDGIPINTGSYSQLGFGNQTANTLADINPTDIESIEILKDAAAAAIYGSRGANGVVLITTKRGKAQKTQVNLNTYYGGQTVWRTLEPLSGPEFVDLIQEGVRNRFGATIVPSQLGLVGLNNDPSTYPNTNWQDEIFRTGAISQTDLSFAGGNERTKFFVSGSYFLQDGTIKGSSFDRTSFRLNLDNLVTDKFKIGTSTSFSRSFSTRINNDNNIFGVLSTAFLLGSHIPAFNADGTYGRDPNASIENPIAAYREPTNDRVNNRLLSSVYGEYTLAPGLNFRTSVSADFISVREIRFSPTTTNAGAGTGGTGNEAFSSDLNLVNENYLTYRKSFGNLGFDALLGASFQTSTFESFFGQGENFPGNTIITLNAASIKRDVTSSRSQWGLNSYFSRFNFNWQQKYFISASARYDGSSRFGANTRWGFFPAVSGAWRISEESFLRNNSVISELKLKGSWGLRGNSEIGNFSSRALISPGANYLQRAGLAPTQLGNPDLTWEERQDIDLGLEIGLFKDRIFLTVEAFQGTTNELLLSRPLVASSGFTGITENIGSIKNRGIDIGLLTTNISKEKFTWTTNMNLSFFENEITALAGTPFAAGFASWVAEGEALGSFRGFRVERVFQSQEEIDALNAIARERTGNPNAVYQTTLTRPGDLMFRDLDGDGVLTTADQEILGNANPRVFGGITNNISAFGFDLSFFFQFSVGNLVYNNTRAFSEGMNSIFGQAATVRNRWTPENPTDDIRYPRAAFGDPNNNRRTSDRFLEDASYLRLKNLSLGYSLPRNIANKAGLASARIYVSGQNLLTFTEYSGFDPEVSTFTLSNTAPGTDFLTFPQARTMIVGLNLGF